MEAALLIHTLEWNFPDETFDLGGGVRLNRTKGSQVEALYHSLCDTQNIDQGEPFDYESHASFDDGRLDDHLSFRWGGPWSKVAQLVTTINLCTQSPVGMCRLMITHDHFKTAVIPTEEIYEDHEDRDFLRVDPASLVVDKAGAFVLSDIRYPILDPDSLTRMATCWSTFQKLNAVDDIDNHRVRNALSYFFYAWRSYYMDHICLNLAITLESLFAPPNQGEIAHQIAFNASQFSGSSRQQKEQVYDLVKRFYGVRSIVVHGGRPKDEALLRLTPAVYWLCVEILRAILGDFAIARRFCHEEERRAMLRDWLFE